MAHRRGLDGTRRLLEQSGVADLRVRQVADGRTRRLVQLHGSRVR